MDDDDDRDMSFSEDDYNDYMTNQFCNDMIDALNKKIESDALHIMCIAHSKDN